MPTCPLTAVMVLLTIFMSKTTLLSAARKTPLHFLQVIFTASISTQELTRFSALEKMTALRLRQKIELILPRLPKGVVISERETVLLLTGV